MKTLLKAAIIMTAFNAASISRAGNLHSDHDYFAQISIRYDAVGRAQAPAPEYLLSPVYPLEYWRAAVVGGVRFDVVVETDGCIDQVRFIESTANLFTKAVAQALKGWRFYPSGSRHGGESSAKPDSGPVTLHCLYEFNCWEGDKPKYQMFPTNADGSGLSH
jgi:hypothetical protein